LWVVYIGLRGTEWNVTLFAERFLETKRIMSR
jgi:hypothetical protein